MKQIKLINKEWRILQKSIALRGAGSISGKYVRLSSSIAKTGTNNYTMTISVSSSSTYVYSICGVRVYAHIGSQKIYKGTVYISGGACSPNEFTHSFSIGSTVSCYASCRCADCEDGKHADDGTFTNQTSADTATYVNPGTPPKNARLTLDKTGVVEGRITATTSYQCDYPYGTVTYNYARSVNGVNWVESGWISSPTAGYTITDIQRGATHRFRVNVRNGKGESGWSPIVTVKANSLPSDPSNLRVSNNRPTGTTTLMWNASTDPDGQTIGYAVSVYKNGARKYLGTTHATSMVFDTSPDAQGTRYNFVVSAYDTLGAYSPSEVWSGDFYKATQPANQSISLNKSGVAEGSVTATASYTSSYPTGTTEYQFSYYYDGIGWQELGWSTSRTLSMNITSHRGVNWYFCARIRNGAGTSAWTNTVSIKANSIPSVVHNLVHSPRYPSETVTLSWNAASDADNQTITYKVYIQKNNGGFSYIGATTSTSLVYNIASDGNGTRYRYKVEAHDTLGAYSTSPQSGEFFKPIPPTMPSFTAPTATIHETNVTVSWSASDFHSLNGYYVLEKNIDGGGWTSAVSSTTSTSYTFNIASINRGSSVQFRVRAVNEANQASAFAVSQTIRRNRVPSAVTNITPAAGYYLGALTFAWGTSIDPDGHAVTYRVYLSKNNGAYTLLGSTSNTSYGWAVPNGDASETTYRIKVESIDTLGASSSATGPLLKKPTPPSAPTNLGPGTGYYEGFIDFTWTASNFYGQQGNYHLEIYVNNILVKTDTSNTNSYRYDLSGVPRGSGITYKVKAKNRFNQESAWVTNSANMRHNRIPEAPSFILPLANRPINSRVPKIIIKSNREFDGQKMSVNVSYNGASYNSAANPELFSKTLIGNDEHIIFKPTNNLNVGNNTIIVSVNDGLVNSPNISSSIKVEDNINYVDLGDVIQSSHHNTIIQAINKARAAYGLGAYNFKKVNIGEYIKAENIRSFVAVITELTNKIDSYHVDSKLKYNFNYERPAANNSIITKESYNRVSEALNNL